MSHSIGVGVESLLKLFQSHHSVLLIFAFVCFKYFYVILSVIPDSLPFCAFWKLFFFCVCGGGGLVLTCRKTMEWVIVSFSSGKHLSGELRNVHKILVRKAEVISWGLDIRGEIILKGVLKTSRISECSLHLAVGTSLSASPEGLSFSPLVVTVFFFFFKTWKKMSEHWLKMASTSTRRTLFKTFSSRLESCREQKEFSQMTEMFVNDCWWL